MTAESTNRCNSRPPSVRTGGIADAGALVRCVARSVALALLAALLAAPAEAAIVYLGQSNGANNALPTDGTAGSLTIPQPSGVSAGRALIASIAARPRSMTVTVPAGWTLMTATDQPAGGVSTAPGGMTLLTYYKIATASEPASYTWTFANPTLGQGGSAVGGILLFSGVDTSASPIDVWSARLTPNGTTHSTNSITPTVTNTMIVSSISFLSSSTFGNPSGIAGITERLDVAAPPPNAAVGTTLQMSTAPWATATATGASQAVAASDADTGVGHLMALKPSLIDLDISMVRSGPLNPGGSASYTLTVANNGINPEPGPLTVVDTLPAGLSYASFSGTGWACGVAGQVVTCTCAGALGAGASAAALVLNVNVSSGASGTLTNTATVSGTGGDGTLANNTATDSYTIPSSLALGFCDDFESGLGNWTIASSGGDAGTSTVTANSGSSSMFTRWGVVTVTLGTIDTTVASSGPKVTAWIRRGDDAFSENPDAGEDLVIEYLNNVGTWVALETFPGNGTPGEILNRTYVLGVDAVHAGFQLRFRQTGGSGSDFDYWHVDDVCVLNNQPTYYGMDEATWAATGDVIDGSGNGNNGDPLGGVSTDATTPAIAGNPGTCGYGVFPGNTSTATFDAVDSKLTPGDQGSVSFWYRSNANWSGGGDKMLLDASNNLGNNGADKYFFLVKRNNGRLRFRLEDSNDTDSQAETGGQSIAANTWVHIAITWDLPNDRLEVYINGTLSATSNTNLNGTIGNLNSLYIGDNRTTGVGGSGYTGNSADGLIDEVRIYSAPLSAAAVAADMNATHACGAAIDHYDISYPSGATAVTCESLTVRITAHDAADAPVDAPSGTVMTFATTTGTGVWLAPTVAGTGTWTPSGLNNGQASYTWPGGESVLDVRLRHNTPVAAIAMNLGGMYSESATEDPAAAFVDSGFRVTNAAGVASVSIGTQIAGKDSNTGLGAQTLFLQAIRTDSGTGSCVGVFPSQTVTVQLASECNNPGACVPTPGSQVRVRNSAAAMVPIAQNNNAAVGSYSNVSLAFDAQSKAPLMLNYPDVGQIALHARYALPAPPSTFMLGSSNAFVVKPAGFVVSNIIRTGDSFANPAAADATGAAFIHAGDAFTATVTAVANDGVTPTPNFGRESTPEGVVLSQTLIAPAGGNNGTLSNATVPGTEFGAGGMVSDANGLATVTNLSWNEVGIIQLSGQIADNNYLGAGAAPNTYASANIGRFTPDHFAVIGAMTLINRSNLACAGSPFTYLGEPLRLAFQLEARELSGGRVLNYLPSGVAANNFAKLAVTNGGVFGVLSGTSALNANPDTSSRIGVTASGANAWQTGANGGRTNVLAVDATFARRNDNAVDGAFEGTEIGIAPQDATDNVGLAAAALNRDWVAPAGNDHLFFNTTNLRFGRVALENVFGSELVPLSMGMEAEYYFDASTGFVTNGDDACTIVGNPQLDLSNDISNPPQGTLSINTNNGPPVKTTNVSIDNSPFSAGVGNLTFTAPGDGGDGFADVSVDLSGWSWLRFDWDGNGVNDNDPVARATFGIYEGNPRQIYLRERY
jgi:MSHA biogenesis protein MshQ